MTRRADPVVPAEAEAGACRVDVWLWAARFFRTRRLSHDAIAGGKIEWNGATCKPARTVAPGDRLRIQRGNERIEVEVLAVGTRRGPAAAAQALYRESAASVLARSAAREALRLEGPRDPVHRPDKADRRALRRLKQRT